MGTKSTLEKMGCLCIIHLENRIMEGSIISYRLGNWEGNEDMTETGTGLNTDTILRKVNNRIGEKFAARSLNGSRHFELPNGEIIIICELISFGALVVEYADNIDEAEKNRFEDGELFYLSDYQDVDELASDILQEIEKGIFG